MLALAVAPALVALALAGAACGGNSGGDDTVAAAKRRYIEQADAKCQVFNDRLGSLEGLARTNQAAAATEALPAAETLVTELRRLSAPPGDEQLSMMLRRYEDALGDLRALVAAHQLDDKIAVQQRFNDLEAKMRGFDRLASSYGFKVCGGI